MPLMGLKTDKLYLPWARITEVPAGVGGDPNWANVQGKPTTLAGFGLDAEVAAAAGGGLGYGQVYANKLAQRTAGINYVNTGQKPRFVSVVMGGGYIATIAGYVDGLEVTVHSSSAGTQGLCYLIVQPGSTYKVTAELGIQGWVELE